MRGQHNRSWLVIVRAGRGSLHSRYAADDASRKYDVLVAAWQDGVAPPEGPNDRLVMQPGQKIAGYHSLFERFPDLLDTYTHIALVDDDIDMSPEAVNRSFEAGSAENLSIWQPSLTWDSYFSYAAFLRNPAFQLRYTNFVEMMCPFFRADALRKALPLFDLGYDVGPDLVWTRLEEDNHCRAAILDTVSVHHTRPVGKAKRARTEGRFKRYDSEVQTFLDQAGLGFRGNVVYAAKTRGGRALAGRGQIAFRYMALMAGFVRTPMVKWKFLRLVSDAIRHVLIRPKSLDPIDAQSVAQTVRMAQAAPSL